MRVCIIGRSRSGTTVTSRILRHPPDLFIVNESGLYSYPGLLQGNYGSYVKKSVQKAVVEMSGGRDRWPKIRKRLMAFISDRGGGITPKDMILKAEEEVFRGVRVYGDKGGVIGIPWRIKKVGLKTKFIFIHRDGRDVCTSSYRKFLKGKRSGWTSDDIAFLSDHWVRAMKVWEEEKKNLKSSQFIELRFEDYVKNPGLNSEKCAKFLRVDKKALRQREFSAINRKKSHVGYFKDFIPNWQKQFSKEAKQYLKKYGYA